MRLAENLQNIKNRLTRAAHRAGRSPEEITLVAVTKTVGRQEIKALAALGVRDVGENRIQEALRKKNELGELAQGFNWHLIGTLQRNKARRAVENFDLIHSLDRWELATEINKFALQAGKKVSVLIQVNVAGEATKHGLAPVELLDFCREIKELPGLCLRGLMTMAPLVPRAEEVRPVFFRLRELFQKAGKELALGENWRHLSMGMTNDYEVAVEEGATIVRIGTAIFQASEEGLDEKLG